MIESHSNEASGQPKTDMTETGHWDEMLDEALEESFPASDPIASLQSD